MRKSNGYKEKIKELLMNNNSLNNLMKENLISNVKQITNNEIIDVKKSITNVAFPEKDNTSKDIVIMKNSEAKRKNSLQRSLTYKAKTSRLSRFNSLHVIRIL